MNLREIRELAEKIHRHPTTVFRWLNRTRSISAEDAKLLETATGIDRRAWMWPDEYENPHMGKRSVSA